MPKQRISSVDIRHLVRELRERCVGLRLANLYDVTPRVYMLKFARADHKEFVIIESGVRLHTTAFARAKPTLPSGFTMKLRKHIRTWRLESVDQLGLDRVVDLSFGTNESCYHLILEFYAKGNVILTDHEYTILALLRTHRQDEESLYAVRERYPVERAAPFAPMTLPRLTALLADGAPGTPIRQLLSGKTEYGPAQIDHCLLVADVKPNTKLVPGFPEANPEAVGRLLAALQAIDALIVAPASASEGLVYKKVAPEGSEPPTPETEAALYEHFSAFPLAQFSTAGYEAQRFPTFNAAVDHYFSKLEGQRAGLEVEGKQHEKLSKVEKVKRDHEDRIRELQRVQEHSEHKATLIIVNAAEVEAAIAVIRSALAQSVDWTELRRVVKAQRRAGNPIAMMIDDFNFEQNKITLLLSDNTDDAAEADLTAPVEKVAVDISLSAHANARTYFDAKKKCAAKEDKTKAATTKALKSAQRKADTDLRKEVPVGPTIKVMRKPFWFEKFNWFITTENLLVLSGRDAQQNELLVKRHLRPGDLYVHADFHGASSCILKNPSGKVVPPVSLSQAGTMCVCRSSAWDNKVVTSSWWVYHNQVSKTAPTGEYLPTGSFMIRGRKNFLPPTPLVMGIALLWRVAEECIPNHVHERRPPDQFALNTYHLETMPVEGADPAHVPSLDDESGAAPSVSLTAGDAVSASDGGRDASPCPPSGSGFARDSAAGSASPLGSAGSGHASSRSSSSSSNKRRGEEGEEEEEGPAKPTSQPGPAPPPLEGVNTDFDRYGLHQSPFDPTLGREPPARGRGGDAAAAAEDGTEGGGGAPERSGKKRMSMKERRALKQQRKAPARGEPTGDSEAAAGDPESPPAAPPSPLTPAPPPPEALPNGAAGNPKATPAVAPAAAPAAAQTRAKKGKVQRRLQQKYGEQDEEDRMLAMLLLGHRPKPLATAAEEGAPAPAAPSGKRPADGSKTPRSGPGRPPSAAREAPHPRQPNTAPVSPHSRGEAAAGAGPAAPPKGVEASAAAVDLPPEASGSDADGGGGGGGEEAPPDAGAEAQAAAAAAAEQAEVRRVLQEEGLRVLDDEERERADLTDLDSLTGTPLPTDALLFAIPVCAPLAAVQGYKYTVKVTPGPLKRGKAAAAVEKHFQGLRGSSEGERLLIRAIDHQEMINAVVGNCRLSIAGAVDKKAAGKAKGKG